MNPVPSNLVRSIVLMALLAASACASAGPTGPMHPMRIPFDPAVTTAVDDQGVTGAQRAEFVSTDSDTPWQVFVDDLPVCHTPCSGWLAPSRRLALQPHGKRQTFRVAPLEMQPFTGPVRIEAQPPSRAKTAVGIVFTTLGGMAVVTGIPLLAIGCPQELGSGLCVAGMITAGAGALVTAPSIWLIVDGQPSISIGPARSGEGGAGLNLRLAPGTLAGTF